MLWGVLVVGVAPFLLGVVLGLVTNNPLMDGLLDRIGLGYLDRMPSSWDYICRLEREMWIRARLKDGGRYVGGYMGKYSFSSSSYAGADLYIDTQWQLDEYGNFVEPLPDSWGFWLARGSVETLELFIGSPKEGNHAQAGEAISTRDSA
jgi:hypothetical protein